MINYVLEMLDLPNPEKSDAAVIGFYNWAKANNKLRKTPQRGYLCLWLNKDGTGHIGIVVSKQGNLVQSIEGNTGPGDAGSQRDGDGCYRRYRRTSVWQHYIEI